MKKFLRWLIHTVMRLITRVEPIGYENLPDQGGFVIAVNHLGFLDTPLAYYMLDNWNLFIPPPEFCTDNAAMIASVAFQKYLASEFSPANTAPHARMRW